MKRKIKVEIDRDSVSAGDDLDSHRKEYEIDPETNIESLLRLVVQDYGLPNVADDHVWFIGKCNGAEIFIIHRFGKKGLLSWQWRDEIKFIKEKADMVESLPKLSGSIRVQITYYHKGRPN